MKNKGFTLVEFLMYFGIIIPLLLALVAIGVNLLNSREMVAAREEIGYNGRVASGRISYLIRDSYGAEVVEDSLFLDYPRWSDRVEITTEDGRLVIYRGEDRETVTTDRTIAEADFERIGDRGVQINLNLIYRSYQGQGHDLERSFHLVEKWRN